jgi:hypothetical protein
MKVVGLFVQPGCSGTRSTGTEMPVRLVKSLWRTAHCSGAARGRRGGGDLVHTPFLLARHYTREPICCQ